MCSTNDILQWNFFFMIRILFDIENWLWKSEFCTFWQLLLKWPQYYWPWRPVEINFQFSIHNMISADSWDSSELLRSAHCIVINDMSHTKDSLTFDVMEVWHPIVVPYILILFFLSFSIICLPYSLLHFYFLVVEWVKYYIKVFSLSVRCFHSSVVKI